MPPPDPRAAIASGLTYLLVAGALCAAGFGAIGVRAWAPPTLVSLAWIWLLTGAMTVSFVALIVPALPVPPEIALGVRAILLGIVTIAGVGVPAAILILLRRVEPARADAAVPQPVLVLAAALAATSVLALPTLVRPVVPVLHVVLTGWPAAAATAVLALVCAWLAREVYRRNRRGLTGTALLFAATGASLAITALTVEPSALAIAMGAQPADAELLTALPVGRGTLAVGAVIATLASLVWLASLRRHFRPTDRGDLPPPDGRILSVESPPRGPGGR